MQTDAWLYQEVAGISAMAKLNSDAATLAAKQLVARLDELPRRERRRAKKDLTAALKAIPLIAHGIEPAIAGWLVNHPHKARALEAAGLSEKEIHQLVRGGPGETEAFGELLRASEPSLARLLVSQLRTWAMLHRSTFTDAALRLGAFEARREILGDDLGLFVLERDSAALVIDGWLEAVLSAR
jgi:hypothetical protein